MGVEIPLVQHSRYHIPPSTGHSLIVTFSVAFGIQLLAYIVSSVLKTERLYDLSGTLTYVACTLVALLWRQRVEPLSALGFRQILCASCVLLWSLRLGFFLYKRVLKVEDKRFDKFKITPLAFIIPFFIQAVWIFVTALPVWVILSNPCSTQTVWDWPDILGGILWVMGFAIEIIADETKASFKKSHPHDFVTTGIWAYSRYANYFGEITLWVGMFIMCISGFTQTWQWVTIISPIFVFCLIVFVSGIPILEASSQRRYGDRADYQIYVARTSTLFPWPPRKAAIASSSVSDRTIQIISQ